MPSAPSDPKTVQGSLSDPISETLAAVDTPTSDVITTRPIPIYEHDGQRWDRLAEQLGYPEQAQADLFREVLIWAESHLAEQALAQSEPNLETGIAVYRIQSSLLDRLMGRFAPLMTTMTALIEQFQSQQQQQQQLNQSFAQILQAITSGSLNESVASRGATTAKVRSTYTTVKHTFGKLDSQDLKKSHAKGSAEEKLRRAFQAIVDHNETADRSQIEKWAVNQNALAELTGCNRPAIKQFLKQYGAEIEAHHRNHGLLPRHNYAHGKVGTKITDVIHW